MNQPVQTPATAATPFRFTVDQFLALCEQGLFDAYAKSELIEGEIVVMNAQHSRDSRIKTRLAIRLGNALEALGSPFEPLVEASVRLDDGSLPEPDIVLTRYRGTGVVPVETVALVIEVSDSTLETDLEKKAGLYAKAGVPEYWVIDANNRVSHQLWALEGKTYRERRALAFGQAISAATIVGLTTETAQID